jgi:hypothetical protein
MMTVNEIYEAAHALSIDIKSQGFESDAYSIEEAMLNGSTGTEILANLAVALRNIQRGSIEISIKTEEMIKAIDKILVESGFIRYPK